MIVESLESWWTETTIFNKNSNINQKSNSIVMAPLREGKGYQENQFGTSGEPPDKSHIVGNMSY